MSKKKQNTELIRIAVLGGSGRIGSMVTSRLLRWAESENGVFVVCKNRENFDFSNPAHVYEWLDLTKPTVVINLIFSKTGNNHDDWIINLGCMDAAAKYSAMHGTTFIYLSCCRVFEGYRYRPNLRGLHESYPLHPETILGSTHVARDNTVLSLAAKPYVRQSGFRYFGLRCGLVLGSTVRPDPVLESAFALIRQRVPIIYVNDRCATSVISVSLLVDCILWFIQKRRSIESGIYHVAARGAVTESTLLDYLTRFGNHRPIIHKSTTPERSDFRLFDLPDSPTPRYLVLNCSKFEATGFGRLPSWQEDLEMWYRGLRELV